MTTPRSRLRVDDERGAVLVLALVFVLVVGMTIGAIVNLVSANLVVTRGLQTERGTQYGAGAAVEGAIQANRYTTTTPASCTRFPTGAAAIAINSQSLVVDCTIGVPNGFNGRIVQFDACLSAYASTLTTCQQHAIVEANVVYDDVGSTGSTVTVTSWDVKTADG